MTRAGAVAIYLSIYLAISRFDYTETAMDIMYMHYVTLCFSPLSHVKKTRYLVNSCQNGAWMDGRDQRMITTDPELAYTPFDARMKRVATRCASRDTTIFTIFTISTIFTSSAISTIAAISAISISNITSDYSVYR